MLPTIPRDRPSADEFRGLERLDREELDEVDGEAPPAWDDDTGVRSRSSSPPSGSTAKSA